MLPEMLEDPYVEVSLQAPPSLDYIPGPEEPEQAPPSPDYVPGPEHADDEIVAEDQPYTEDASPIAQSPEYVSESDFEAHPEDDDDEDPEEDPVDYFTNGGDDSDDEEESSEDDEDDDMDIEADKEEEEEHPAPADSVVVALTAADQALSADETKPFETDESAATPPPHPTYRMPARISIPAPVPMPAWTDSEVVRLLAISSLPAASTSSPPLQLPSASRREDRPEVTLPPQKRLDASDLVRGEDMSLRTTVLGQMIEIRELHAADRRRQTVISELLRTDHRRSTEIMELRTALQGQVTAYRDSNCTAENQVKFATCTLHSVALTWWNTHVQTIGHEAAYDMSWKMLMKMMTEKYCPRNEIRKLEMELWDLKVKDSDMIHGSVVASKPTTMQEAIEIATELMDKKIRTFAEHEIVSKRKFENTLRNTQNQQQQHSNKRQNNVRVYTAAAGEKKQYGGSKTLCAKCNYHHDGPCAPKCRNCNKIGHFARDYRSAANTNNANNQRGTGSGQRPACYECGVQGHFKRECPKLKDSNNHGNQGGRNNAPARVYTVGRAGTDPD
nr:hypothetical protein [Tanacetum cinerariifolium]